MSQRPVEIGMPMQVNRYLPASMTLELAKGLQASGVVDYLQGWDQLSSWWPSYLWNAENTEHAAVAPDADSFPDWVSMLSYALAAAPGMGTSMSIDAIRRGPAETMQTMLTMANLTEGKSQFHMGSGEVKNTAPFGWNRREGFKRYVDLLQIFQKFWESDEPISFEGKVWNLDRAWIGGAKPYRPEVWGLGGGPKIIDAATSYADGFATLCPQVAYSPERCNEMWTTMKEQLESKGRDPDKFGFGLYATMVLHENDDVIDAGLANPLMQWMTATFGRVTMADWDVEGIEPPFPRDWHYAMDLVSLHLSKEEAEDYASRATPEMHEAAFLRGTPQKVAGELQAFIEAGATWISVIDLLPTVLPLEEAEKAMGRSLELAGLLKAGSGAAVAGAEGAAAP